MQDPKVLIFVYNFVSHNHSAASRELHQLIQMVCASRRATAVSEIGSLIPNKIGSQHSREGQSLVNWKGPSRKRLSKPYATPWQRIGLAYSRWWDLQKLTSFSVVPEVKMEISLLGNSPLSKKVKEVNAYIQLWAVFSGTSGHLWGSGGEWLNLQATADAYNKPQ